jgi:hypothetical protein
VSPIAICAGLALAGGLLVPREAHAFCRTTTTPIPANFNPTRGCYTEGLPLFWKGACVGYSVNSAASASIPFATATEKIDSAFATWNHVVCASGTDIGITTSNLGPVTCSEVKYNPNGPNQNVIVFRDDKWPYSDPNNTLGLTTVTFNADTGEIYDADMEINATGKNLTITDQVPGNGFDLLSVLTHEAGHFLGLAHATSPTSTMYASYKPGTSSLRTLAPDDIVGVCEIYPSTKERTVAESVDPTGMVVADACDPTPRHGFGTGCAENPPPVDHSSSSGCMVASPSNGTNEIPNAFLVVVATLGVTVLVIPRRRRRAPPR